VQNKTVTEVQKVQQSGNEKIRIFKESSSAIMKLNEDIISNQEVILLTELG